MPPACCPGCHLWRMPCKCHACRQKSGHVLKWASPAAAVLASRPGAVAPGSMRLFYPAEVMTAFLFRHMQSALGLLRFLGVR